MGEEDDEEEGEEEESESQKGAKTSFRLKKERPTYLYCHSIPSVFVVESKDGTPPG